MTLTPHQIAEMQCKEDEIQRLIAEREGMRRAAIYWHDNYDRAVAALADAIRRPMGVVPATAEGLVTQSDLDAAEKRRPMYSET